MTWGCLSLLGLAASTCGRGGPGVVAYTSVDQVVSEPIFRTFEAQSGVAVHAVFDTEETKSTGVLNRLLAEAQSPRADVFWSGDPVRPFILIARGLVEPYVSPNAAGIPAPFKASDGAWTGFAARARILLVNTRRVAAADRPASIRDLASPRWKGQAAMANPLFGTTTIHMAALFTAWGDEPARAFLHEVKANDVRIASSNGEVKRLVASGEVAFGLTDTDDAAEAVKDGAPVAVVYPDQDALGTLVLPTAVVLIKGGPHPESGRRLVDALLAPVTEQRMAESAAHMPLRGGLTAGTDVRGLDRVRAMQVDYASVASAMERIQPFLREWVGL
ncbi:MAG: extracellular solute-binding protein [Deltaproteobacteria bacterium]|nr:MAG: extracellular solute-binding protein [Deltaproteobacteria bacterium]